MAAPEKANAPAGTRADEKAAATANDSQGNGRASQTSHAERKAEHVKRLPSEGMAQLKRMMSHAGYLAAGASAKALADRAVVMWADGAGKFWHSNATMANAMGVDESNVRRALTQLETLGVFVFPEGRRGGRVTNLVVVRAALRAGENALGRRKRARWAREIALQTEGS